MRIPIGKLLCESDIDRYRLVVPIRADVERQRVAFAELVGVDAAAEQLRVMQENIGAGGAILLDEAKTAITQPFSGVPVDSSLSSDVIGLDEEPVGD